MIGDVLTEVAAETGTEGRTTALLDGLIREYKTALSSGEVSAVQQVQDELVAAEADLIAAVIAT